MIHSRDKARTAAAPGDGDVEQILWKLLASYEQPHSHANDEKLVANAVAALAARDAQRDSYDARVRENVELAARAGIPAEWVDPGSGKKLLNEAAVAQRDKRVALEERICVVSDLIWHHSINTFAEDKLIVEMDKWRAELAHLQGREEDE